MELELTPGSTSVASDTFSTESHKHTPSSLPLFLFLRFRISFFAKEKAIPGIPVQLQSLCPV